MDIEKIEGLFSEEENIEATGQSESLVNLDDLFSKVNAKKIDALIQESDKIERRGVNRSYSRKNKGIVNEDYLRELIADEVNMALDKALDAIEQRINNSMERIATLNYKMSEAQDNGENKDGDRSL